MAKVLPSYQLGGERAQSQLANNFVSKHFQEASLKPCLLSLVCIQLKTLPIQPKKFQSKACQCLFTVKESASTFVQPFQIGMKE